MAILLKPKPGKGKTFKRDIKDQDIKSNSDWSSKPVQKKNTKAQFDIGGLSSYKPGKLKDRSPKPEVSESTKPAYTDIKKIVSTKEAMVKRDVERQMTAEAIKQSPTLSNKQKTEILMSPEKLDENVHLIYAPKNTDAVKASVPQSTASRTWDIVSNPLDAFTYAVSGGGVQNMPHHYSDMEHAGVVDPLTDRNSVGKALEFASYFNPITGLAQGIKDAPYTAQDINKAVKSGRWEDIKKAGESTMYNILDVVPAAAIGKWGRMSDGASGLVRRTNEFVPNASFNNFVGNRLLPFTSRFESQVPRSIDQTLIGKAFPQLNPNHIKYNPTARAGYNLVADAAKGKAIADATDATIKVVTQPWQLKELPGLHLKSTMENNPQGLHKYVAKDGSIDTKSALDHLKRMEGDAKYEVVLKNIQNKYGANLENMPKRMDYNTLRKNIQDDLWDIGTGKGQQVDRYAGMDMKEFGIVKKDKGVSLEYDPDEINLTGYSFSNKNKFMGGSDAHNMPKETLGHSRGFTNPNEPGVYYSAERQSNWAQEMTNTSDPLLGGKVKRADIHERLQKNEVSLKEAIKEQDDLIAAGNQSWAISQKERLQSQLKEVQETLAQNNKYINASPQEKLVMKNMNERMLQEDVAYAASQGHTEYRLPSEESMAKIQGYSREKILTPEAIAKRDGMIEKQNKVFTEFQKAIGRKDKIAEDLYSKQYDDLNLEIKKISETATLGGYNSAQSTILKHTNQSLKDAEKLFGVKLKPITDSRGNTWYKFDIPENFKKGKGEIKAFSMLPYIVPTAFGVGAAATLMNNPYQQQNMPSLKKGGILYK